MPDDDLTLTDSTLGAARLARQPDGSWAGTFSHWPDRLAALADLKRGWNGYDAQPPNEAAIANARAFLDVMLALDCPPTRIGPSTGPGVAISRIAGPRHAYVEFRNDGGRQVMFSDDAEPEPDVFTFPPGIPPGRVTVAMIRGFLGE